MKMPSVFADADQAAKAARKGFELNERVPVATRMRMVEAMRKVTLANNELLARYAASFRADAATARHLAARRAAGLPA